MNETLDRYSIQRNRVEAAWEWSIAPARRDCGAWWC